MIEKFARRRIVVVAMGALLAVSIQFGAAVFAPPTALAQPNMQRGEWIMAIAPGETLRVIGVSNPWARNTGDVLMRFQLFSAYGNPLVAPVSMTVRHGTMAFSDIPRVSVGNQGEPTGRIQMRIIYDVVAPVGSTASDFTPLAEVFDTTTGRTTQRTGPIADVLYSAAGN